MNTNGMICESVPTFQPGPRDRVRWAPERTADWAGASVGEVIGFEPQRLFFGADSKPERPTEGPAYELRLDGPAAHRVWVAPKELFPETQAVIA